KSFNISGYLGKLKEVQNKLRSAPGDEWIQVVKLKDDPNFQSAMDQTRDTLQPLRSSPNAAKSAASLLELPLVKTRKALENANVDELNKKWSGVVAMARQLEAKYPFSDSGRHVQATELKQFLNPVDGQLSKFYNESAIKDNLDGNLGQLKLREQGGLS